VFLEAGGEKFEYIPALNDSAAHISLIESVCKKAVGE
jgi:ferrochelatase